MSGINVIFFNIKIVAIGCQTNESLSCLNNGTCLHSGGCECPFGYGGIRCENCK